MKKLLALVLVLTLVLGMGVGVFAEEYEDWSPIEIKKELTLTNSDTISPAETFNFTVGDGEVLEGNASSAPAFDPDEFSIALAQGALSGSANITLPDFDHVGVYEYEVKEVAGNTAGMDYDGNTYYLRVTVINNEEEGGFIRVLTLVDGNDVKEDAFQNTFSAGDLTVTKVIEGNFADPNDEFEIIVTLTPVEGKVLNSDAIKHVGGTISVLNEETGAVKIVYSGIKGGASFTIQNIPYDVNYLVEEVTGEDGLANGYEVAYDEFAEGLMDSSEKATTITNTRITEVPTGVNLDNLPYVLILGAASVGLVAFTLKRRFSDDR
jgi:pilin isopeptide linkage protein